MKVFSLEKFKEWYEMLGLPNPKESFNINAEIWAKKCDGLTEEEMKEFGFVCSDVWTIEVEEQNE